MSKIEQWFLEVMLFINGRPIQVFYGPFFWDQDRNSFREDAIRADRRIYEELHDERHNPARIKYLSHDSVPGVLVSQREEWEFASVAHYPGTFYWFRREDAGDCQPYSCHED